MNSWISVKDRLPDVDPATKTSSILIVRTIDNDYMTAIFDTAGLDPAVFWRLSDGEIVLVTHWISLPELPTTESE